MGLGGVCRREGHGKHRLGAMGTDVLRSLGRAGFDYEYLSAMGADAARQRLVVALFRVRGAVEQVLGKSTLALDGVGKLSRGKSAWTLTGSGKTGMGGVGFAGI